MGQQPLAFMEPAVPPERLVGDKGYDGDALDAALNDLGLEMMAPHRRNRRPETATQDGRPRRRYQRRWIVERTLAWLGPHRRLLTRWEKHAANEARFAVLGCLMIALRHLPSWPTPMTFRTASSTITLLRWIEPQTFGLLDKRRKNSSLHR
jgi:transposase